MKIKKVLALMLSVTMAAAMLAGCGDKTNGTSSDQGETTEAVQDMGPRSAGVPIADNAVDFAKSLKLGWNLGNTLDAVGGKTVDSETAWGQPVTKKELIDFVKESGFTSIRIPVTWGSHIDENYNIDPAWMARVTEVVDYAIDDGLYVIINTHHDCDYYYPSEEKFSEGEAYIKALWTQICENFKNYDESLIFESMNEPRLTNTNKEWWFQSNDPEGVASIECISKLNQVFVDTVRSTDGYNTTRYLMVPSNAASPDNALHDAFVMPTDPANRLMVSVHAYSPYDFAMNATGYDTWDGSKINDLGFMDKLNDKFIKNGYGVVIGEFGATNKDNLESRVAWAKDYTGKAASLGISCILWDNGGTKVGGENFGMINRLTRTVYYPDILSAMVASYEEN